MDKDLNLKIQMLKVPFYDVFTECLNGDIGLNELMLCYNELNRQISELIINAYMNEKSEEE